MTIENNLERIANALENIAAAFARIDAGKQPMFSKEELAEDPIKTKAAIPAVKEKQKVTEAANEPAEKVDYQDLVKRMQLLQSRQGKDAVKAVLAELKVKSAQDLKEDRYPEALAVVNKAIDTEKAA